MKSQVRFVLFTLFLVMVATSLCFAQTTRPKPQERPKAPAPDAPAPVPLDPVAKPLAVDPAIAKYPNLQKVPNLFQDGLQCLLGKASEINAAYAAAAASGCEKYSAKEGTLYGCHNKVEYQACQAAADKLQTIFKNCKLTEPGTADFFGGTIATPGCNSLGIACVAPIY